MPPSRILAPCGPLLVAALLALTLDPVDTAEAVSEPVLGSPSHLAPTAKGWGRAHPRHVFNGGDPSGEVAHLSWRHWGAPTATGRGVTWLLRPEGGYYSGGDFNPSDIGGGFDGGDVGGGGDSGGGCGGGDW